MLMNNKSNFEFIKTVFDQETNADLKNKLQRIYEVTSDAEREAATEQENNYSTCIVCCGIACDIITQFFVMKKYPEKWSHTISTNERVANVIEAEEKGKEEQEIDRDSSMHFIWTRSFYADEWEKNDLERYIGLFDLKGEYNICKHDAKKEYSYPKAKWDYRKKRDVLVRDNDIGYVKSLGTKIISNEDLEFIVSSANANIRVRDVFVFLRSVIEKCGYTLGTAFPKYTEPRVLVRVLKDDLSGIETKLDEMKAENIRRDAENKAFFTGQRQFIFISDRYKYKDEVQEVDSENYSYEKSLTRDVRKKAKDGDAIAHYELYCRYINGYKNGEDEVTENRTQAIKHLRLSADLEYSKAEFELANCYFNGDEVEQDKDKALELYKRAAEQDDEKAQYSLGWMYRYGKGVEKDIKEAVRWFKLGSDNDCPESRRELGICFEFGEGVEQNIKKAKELYEKAAKKDDRVALCNLGFLYYIGKGVDSDYARAKELYEKSAELGWSRAHYCLGQLYEHGHGVETSISEAIKQYQIALDGDYYKAGEMLGRLYDRGPYSIRNYKKAERYYKLAADKDVSGAQFLLAYMYDNGIGVEQDYSAAIELYTKAMENGEIGAANNLGLLYKKGHGTDVDIEKAIELFNKDNQLGDAYAKYNLARLYEHGEGVSQNIDEAIRLYNEAIEKGHAQSLQNLGEILYKGKGTDKNEKRAFELFKEASESGNTESKYWLGFCYQYGKGTKKDLEKAEYWYKQAILDGEDWAEYLLGILCKEEGRYEEAVTFLESATQNNYGQAFYALGDIFYNGKGVERDYEKAKDLFEKGSEKKDENATYMLGRCYQEGIGVEANEKQAFEYYQEAASLGSKEAYDIVRAIDKYNEICYLTAGNTKVSAKRLIELLEEFIESGDVKKVASFHKKELSSNIDDWVRVEKKKRVMSGEARYVFDDNQYEEKLIGLSKRILGIDLNSGKVDRPLSYYSGTISAQEWDAVIKVLENEDSERVDDNISARTNKLQAGVTLEMLKDKLEEVRNYSFEEDDDGPLADIIKKINAMDRNRVMENARALGLEKNAHDYFLIKDYCDDLSEGRVEAEYLIDSDITNKTLESYLRDLAKENDWMQEVLFYETVPEFIKRMKE